MAVGGWYKEGGLSGCEVVVSVRLKRKIETRIEEVLSETFVIIVEWIEKRISGANLSEPAIANRIPTNRKRRVQTKRRERAESVRSHLTFCRAVVLTAGLAVTEESSSRTKTATTVDSHSTLLNQRNTRRANETRDTKDTISNTETISLNRTHQE